MAKEKTFPVSIRTSEVTNKELWFLSQFHKIPKTHMRSHFFKTLVAKECFELYQKLKISENLSKEESTILEKMAVMYE